MVETLPAGFTYSSSTLATDQVTESGQEVTFSLLGREQRYVPRLTLMPPPRMVTTRSVVYSAESMQVSTHSAIYRLAVIPP